MKVGLAGCKRVAYARIIKQGRAKSQGLHFTGSRQITGSRISQGRAKSQGRHFTGSRQITGSAFQRVAPNHRAGYFTGSRQITEIGRSQHSIISRKVCRSQYGAISILHCCTLHTHFTHPTQSSLFSFIFFFVKLK